MSRTANIHRKTNETEVRLQLELDGRGEAKIDTGIGFFDHMLELLAAHALIDLQVQAEGDLQVDFHHTVEDTGICLGMAFAEALGDKAGLRRYGAAIVPLDEALARCVIDFCGRSYLHFSESWQGLQAGAFPAELTEDFLRAFCNHAGATLHCDVLRGKNVHHLIEVVFKALGRAIREAVAVDPRQSGIPSTKGAL